jgi:CubicO group peptidase (beta-lactamase class C family)
VLCAALLAACASDDEGPLPIQGTGVERIDSAMNGVMSRWDPPGISLAVVREGRLVVARAYGTADLAGREALGPHHLFRVASVSKPVTGIAALKAVEDGLLDLDERVFDILSAYRPPDGSGDPRLGDMTVWHLMHHTGGWDLWDYPRDPLFRSQEIADALGTTSPPDPQDLTRWVARQPLAFAPGTAYHYTNIGFVVLARVLEESTGMAYEDYVRRFVLAPAGVTRARLGGITRAERLPDEVEYESFEQDIWLSVFDGTMVAAEPAYGGINLRGFDASSAWVFSAVDLVRLAASVDGEASYPELLAPETQRLMIEVGTPEGTTPLGVAWFLDTRGGETLAWDHSGGMPGTASYLGRRRDGVIVAVITNSVGGDEFFDDLAGGLNRAVDGIIDWPDDDLFPQLP